MVLSIGVFLSTSDTDTQETSCLTTPDVCLANKFIKILIGYYMGVIISEYISLGGSTISFYSTIQVK